MSDHKHDSPVHGDREEEIVELPGIVAQLGELKPGAVITENGMAKLFGRHVTSVKRAVSRDELPPPCRLFGQNVWTAGAIIRYVESRLEKASAEKEHSEKKIRQLSP